MFPTRYYPDRMFAPRYWVKVGATPTFVSGIPQASTLEVQGTDRIDAALVVPEDVTGALDVPNEDKATGVPGA